jgi:hypothetical protein
MTKGLEMKIIMPAAIALAITNIIKAAYVHLTPAGREAMGWGLGALALVIAVGVIVALAVDGEE